MLGIFAIISLATLLIIEFKIYTLLKDDFDQEVELNSVGIEYKLCRRALVLRAVYLAVMLFGYLGCIWPYLFIQDIDISIYIIGIIMLGVVPVVLFAYACYLNIKKSDGFIKISKDEIEYKGRKSFKVEVSDIKKITYPDLCSYRIHLKEKGKKPLYINLNGFYKKKEIRSLINQLRNYSAKLSGRDQTIAHKLRPWNLEIIGKYYCTFMQIVILIALIYACYCCIDYDFHRKDYTAKFNAMGVISGQSENAWPYYVCAAVHYKEAEKDFQKIIKDNLKSEKNIFTEQQIDKLRKWFDQNKSTWTSLKQATSIDYCNAVYEQISLLDSQDRNDFSNPSDTGYGQIKCLYDNINACRISGIIDLDWFDLFKMQLTSSKHFINGKTFIDQLVGYALLSRSIKLFADNKSYEIEDLKKARKILKKYFPADIPQLNIEGEILIDCSLYNYIINLKKIPVQTPLSHVFMLCGSITGTEAAVRERFTAEFQQARKGIEIEEEFSVISFPIMRNLLKTMIGDVGGIYKVSQRANTHLLVAYFLFDLEEYQLIKGHYPKDVEQIRQAGLTSPLPKDVDSQNEIIYLNDGLRAILYAVGKNSKDDGGYKDDKDSDQKRDDIIYWQRNLKGPADK